jgi:hypothetical protein
MAFRAEIDTTQNINDAKKGNVGHKILKAVEIHLPSPFVAARCMDDKNLNPLHLKLQTIPSTHERFVSAPVAT